MTYILPFAREVQVTQGFFGGYRKSTKGTHRRLKHKRHDSTFAIDFGLEEGTQLRAARDGFLVAWKDSGRFNYAQFLEHDADHKLKRRAGEETNYIIIGHDDGTVDIYAHLYFQGVDYELKREWMKYGREVRVEQGQPIGWSGNTGLSTGPHLHFVVCQGGEKVNSIPIQFKDYTRTLDDRVLFSKLHEKC